MIHAQACLFDAAAAAVVSAAAAADGAAYLKQNI